MKNNIFLSGPRGDGCDCRQTSTRAPAGEMWNIASRATSWDVSSVVSGMELDRFVSEHITGPLKMTGRSIDTEARSPSDSPMVIAETDATVKPAILSGGGGMPSDAGDYARFCQMLLNRGELDNVRILSPKTVDLMTSDQLPPSTERHTGVALSLDAFGPTPEMGTSFGLGFAVRTAAGRNPVPGSVGDFSWGGITGTYFWVDPKENLVAVLMIQASGAVPYWRQTRSLVYQALTN